MTGAWSGRREGAVAQSKRRKKKPIIIPLPKVKERGVMPKPGRVIPDPKKEASRKRCRRKVAVKDEEGKSLRTAAGTMKPPGERFIAEEEAQIILESGGRHGTSVGHGASG